MAEITIKSVEGNPLNINVVMTAVVHSMLNGEIITETVDFYPDTSKPVRAYLDSVTARKQYCPTTSVDGNIVYLSCDNATAGVYTLTITCTDTNGKARRYKSDACIEVYDLTSAAEIAGSFDEQTYEMNGVFYTFGGGGTVQSDWDESNPESPAYILNKPDLNDYATDEELQAVEEQIPNVPEWAMQPQKPSYTPQDIGAASASQLTAEQTARQQADTALQNNITAEQTARENADTTLQGNITAEQQRAQAAEQQNASDIDAIEAKIPSAASATNKLADKAFVNSSINSNTATFKGTFNSLAELQAVTGATNNDYGFVIEYDEQGNEYYDRYKYNGSAWVFEYKIESTPFTAAQWAAIQSGITSGDVQKLAALPTKTQLDALLAAKQDTINDLASIRSGASAGATAYQKPSSGIPKSDLSTGVQSSLNKADTALQSYNETDPVFIASPAAGITSNDITEWDGKAEPTPVVNHGTSDTTFALTPNVLHIWGEVTSLTLTLATPADSTIVNEYMFQFTSGSTATTLSLPSSVVWVAAPSINAGATYQVSIVNNLGVIAEFSETV